MSEENVAVPHIDDLVDLLVEHEGAVKSDGRHVVYEDPLGVETIGYGRNLEDRGLSEEEAQYLLENDVEDFYDRLVESFPVVKQLSEVRQVALTDMAFNLGIAGISQFSDMWAAIEDENYAGASVEMLDSLWSEQVGTRANDLADMMRDNQFPYWL